MSGGSNWPTAAASFGMPVTSSCSSPRAT